MSPKPADAKTIDQVRAETLARHNREQAASGKTVPSKPASPVTSSGDTATLDNAKVINFVVKQDEPKVTMPVPQPEGVIPVMLSWFKAKRDATNRKFDKVTRVMAPVEKSIKWAAPKVGHMGLWSLKQMAYRTDANGDKHFSAKRLAKSLVVEALLVAVSPFMAFGAYYYSTLKTYTDVYIPNAGVFVNQQFVAPSKAGHVIAPRDEIFTVLGQQKDDKGKMEPVRFDVDANAYFFFYGDAWRPDLAAAKMVPISPYGKKCDFKATGAYTRLWRPIRTEAARWIDMRAEIVKVDKCTELTSMPPEYQPTEMPKDKTLAPVTPTARALPAPAAQLTK